MAVKIFIKRNVSADNILNLTVLLKKLRGLTLAQPGYIYGETLRRLDKPDECLVISTWRTLDDWKTWVNNENRIAIQNEIDRMLGKPTSYEIYEE